MDTVTSASVTSNATPTTETSAATSAAPSCEPNAADPLAGSREPIPTQPLSAGGEVASFHYTVIQSHFDPCAPLSWDVLAGSLGTQDQPGATAGSQRETVVFFSYGKLLEQQPALIARVDAVTPTGEDTVAASYYVDVGPRAAGKQELLTNTYRVDGATLLTIQDGFAEAPETPEVLDLQAQ